MNLFEKRTKIIVTLGPATNTKEKIELLIAKGVNVFRLNFSHGTHADHEQYISLIRSAHYKSGRRPGIIADLQGPKIRTGATQNNRTITLQEGAQVTITTEKTLSTEKTIFVDYPLLIDELEEQDVILVNDGAVQLRVESIDRKNKRINCLILNTGTYSSHKGVHFPHARLSVASITEKDRRDLEFITAHAHDIDFIALSFVKNAQDMITLRTLVSKKTESLRILAKIEKPEAADNIESIMEQCDGIMVARGDLGIEASMKVIPLLQKDLITRANKSGKTVIVATQMLESMIDHLSPTRAEVTDIANAILDRTDAVMLSGETAIGKYPVEAVDIMAQIIQTAESSAYYPREFVAIDRYEYPAVHAVCHAAALASRDLGNIPIVIFTISGETAFHLSNIRPQAPLVALSPSEKVINQLSLAWNTAAFQIPYETDLPRLISFAEEILLRENIVEQHDQVILVSGTTSIRGATNFMRVKVIGEF